MKTLTTVLLTLGAAAPAFAHSDRAFHTHGAELFLGLAAFAVASIWAYRSGNK